MDNEVELRRAKWLFFGFATFVISGCMSYGELMYAIRGRTAQAEITKAFESANSGRGGGYHLQIEYEFNELDGTHRGGTDEVPLDWTSANGKNVAVRYTPGADGRSRLAGNTKWGSVIFFVGSTLALVIVAGMLLREGANDPGKRKKKRR